VVVTRTSDRVGATEGPHHDRLVGGIRDLSEGADRDGAHRPDRVRRHRGQPPVPGRVGKQRLVVCVLEELFVGIGMSRRPGSSSRRLELDQPGHENLTGKPVGRFVHDLSERSGR
jgi:hypothetical protein